jgi:hypothetical protein
MARPVPDAADHLAEVWASQWISLYARDPQKASEYIGRLSCTLGVVKIMADGAASGSAVTQSFPEVFLGDGLLVSCLMKHMPERHREWLFRNYVDRWYVLRLKKGRDMEQQFEPLRLRNPVRQKVMASRMGISEDRYYELRGLVKRKLFEAIGQTPYTPQVKTGCIATR